LSDSQSSAASLASEKLATEQSLERFSATVVELEAQIASEKKDAEETVSAREAEIKSLQEKVCFCKASHLTYSATSA